MAASPPILPLDLERQIFEVSALSRPAFILNLMLVAWRVNHWVEPPLYRTVIIGYEPIPDFPRFKADTFAEIGRTKSPKTPAFLRNSTRNLMLCGNSRAQTQTYLALFPQIENLWISTSGPGLEPSTSALEIPRLKHLHCELDDLNECIPFSSFSHPLFINVTHLVLFNGFAFRGATLDWMGLVELKCLTHLAFNGRAIIPVCVGLLAALRSLCALLVLRWPMTHLRLLADISYYQVVA
ncbi:hypothetical protein DFH09DRAFT_1173701, partial [Mycena vulgaris]